MLSDLWSLESGYKIPTIWTGTDLIFQFRPTLLTGNTAAAIAFSSSMNLTAQQVPAKALPCKLPWHGLSLADWHVSSLHFWHMNIYFVKTFNFLNKPGFLLLGELQPSNFFVPVSVEFVWGQLSQIGTGASTEGEKPSPSCLINPVLLLNLCWGKVTTQHH